MIATSITCACGLTIDLPVSIGLTLSQVTGGCCDCGKSGDQAPREKVIFPLSWCCGTCFNANPRETWVNSQQHTCAANLSIQALSGCIISRAPKTVEPGTFWAQEEEGRYSVHKILPNGTTEKLREVKTK